MTQQEKLVRELVAAAGRTGLELSVFTCDSLAGALIAAGWHKGNRVAKLQRKLAKLHADLVAQGERHRELVESLRKERDDVSRACMVLTQERNDARAEVARLRALHVSVLRCLTIAPDARGHTIAPDAMQASRAGAADKAVGGTHPARWPDLGSGLSPKQLPCLTCGALPGEDCTSPAPPTAETLGDALAYALGRPHTGRPATGDELPCLQCGAGAKQPCILTAQERAMAEE